MSRAADGDDGIMTCTEARTAIIDTLAGEPSAGTAQALRAHLDGCESCRAARDELGTLWADLGALPAARPRADAEERFGAAIAGAMAAAPSPNGASRRFLRWPGPIAIAAALLLGALAGYGGAESARRRASAVPAPTAMIKASVTDGFGTYLLLLRVRRTAGAQASQQDEARLVAEYARWGEELRAEGKLVAAEKLADDPAQLLGAGMPDVSPMEDVVGGFFLIRASSFAEAQRIAAGCPHLRHGGRIELRAIEPT